MKLLCCSMKRPVDFLSPLLVVFFLLLLARSPSSYIMLSGWDLIKLRMDHLHREGQRRRKNYRPGHVMGFSILFSLSIPVSLSPFQPPTRPPLYDPPTDLRVQFIRKNELGLYAESPLPMDLMAIKRRE